MRLTRICSSGRVDNLVVYFLVNVVLFTIINAWRSVELVARRLVVVYTDCVYEFCYFTLKVKRTVQSTDPFYKKIWRHPHHVLSRVLALRFSEKPFNWGGCCCISMRIIYFKKIAYDDPRVNQSFVLSCWRLRSYFGKTAIVGASNQWRFGA